MTNLFPAILAVTLVSLISFTGALILVLSRKVVDKILLLLVAFAVGAMFGDAFIHIIPEIYSVIPSTTPGSSISPVLLSTYILAGIVFFFIIEKILHWHHFHDLEKDAVSHHHHPVGTINLISDGFHNFLDGVLIAGSFIISIELGLATTVAVVLHEIPQEIGDFATLLKAGYSTKKALIFNFFTALAAIFGTILTYLLGLQIQNLETVLVPMTAGGLIYMAGADLIPMLHTEHKTAKSFFQLVFLLLGIGVMYLILLID